MTLASKSSARVAEVGTESAAEPLETRLSLEIPPVSTASNASAAASMEAVEDLLLSKLRMLPSLKISMTGTISVFVSAATGDGDVPKAGSGRVDACGDDWKADHAKLLALSSVDVRIPPPPPPPALPSLL